MNPVFPQLLTKRLKLRQPLLSDAKQIQYLRSDPSVNKYVKRTLAKTKGEAEDFINRVRKEFEDEKSVTWGICLMNTDELIGTISLWNYSSDMRKAELGYDLFVAYHNKGLMAEAIKIVLQHGFVKMNFEVIEAYTSKHNKASLRLLEKMEFKICPGKVDEDNEDNLIFEKKKA